jgi:hypothetical protein
MGVMPLGLSKVPVESLAAGSGGLLLGLLVGKPVGDALKISPPAATAVLSLISVGIPLLLGPRNLSRQLANIFYGAGVGFGSATVFRLVQSFFAPPAPEPAPAP